MLRFGRLGPPFTLGNMPGVSYFGGNNADLYHALKQSTCNFAASFNYDNMGTDLHCIIRNHFTDRHNVQACRDFVNKTINKLTRLYGVGKDAFEVEYANYGGTFSSFAIQTNLWDIESIQLCIGMWHIETSYHYQQLFFKDQFWRLQLQEIADALGEYELWYCDEEYAWDSPPNDIEFVSFQEWYSSVTSDMKGCNDGKIPDYPTARVLEVKETLQDYLEAYHDTTHFFRRRQQKQPI